MSNTASVTGPVFGFGMPHTPGLGNQVERAKPDQFARISDGFKELERQLSDAAPDVIVAFVNDHFDMFTLRNMPGFGIGLGATHWGPPEESEAWLQQKRGPVPGHSDLAADICQSVTDDGFELYRMDDAEFIHNVLLPKRYVWPDRDIPVVPIFINCFAPPLPSFRRAHELGLAIRKVLLRRPERIAVLASGGLSHWPPIVPDEEGDEEFNRRVLEFNTHGRAAVSKDGSIGMAIMQREIEMSQSGKELINIAWDRDFLDKLANADVDALTSLDHAEVRQLAGPGGAEMLMWVALMGAMGDRRGEVVIYEAVEEWMGGVGLLTYPEA